MDAQDHYDDGIPEVETYKTPNEEKTEDGKPEASLVAHDDR
jgi:hypothetical protein